MNLKKIVGSIILVALMTAAVASPISTWLDATIRILKSGDSPTLSVQYNGAKAAKMEIRINGAHYGYRSLDSNRSTGEITFTIESNLIKQGQNQVEVILYDKSGKELGTQQTTLHAERVESLPVIITSPKSGATVQGSVEIRVTVASNMREAFVSFFVNKDFKSMRNFPPYSYWWDTTTVPNGWVELEAWSFDQSHVTYKSSPVRVYVNNPGGRTERQTADPELSSVNIVPPVGSSAGLKGSSDASTSSASKAAYELPGMTGNPVRVPTGHPIGNKIPDGLVAEFSGYRASEPGSSPTVKIKVPEGTQKPEKTLIPNVEAVPAETEMASAQPTVVSIGVGSRVVFQGEYRISMGDEEVKFDVQPRVTDGIPLTPFRHLYEHAGGEVNWLHNEKVCTANGLGKDVWIKIGDLFARVNGEAVQLELAPFLEKGRTVVPLSFLTATLDVQIQFDPKSGHVLITKAQK